MAYVDSESPLLLGRFELVMALGEGGYGRVTLCRDRDSGELLALKELQRFGPDALMRFKREFRTLSDVQHPNLVRLGELIESDDHWAFTLEYVPGSDALSWVRTIKDGVGGFDESRVRALLRGLVDGLSVIHALGIVHRDIKPENVRVTPEGRVVILDFGIAAQMHDERGTEGMFGTAAYMAPEQANGDKPMPAADWYAVGALLYEALAGRLPFEGGPLEVMLSKQSGMPPLPSSIASNVSAILERICMALLAPAPAERPDGDEILRLLDGQTSDVRRSHATSTRGDEVFIGREHELTELRRHLVSIDRGATRLILVEGESGIGKSALVRRFVAETRRVPSKPLVLSGRCHAAERLLYKAFDGVVDELSRYLKAQDDAHVAALLPDESHLLPVLFPVLTRVPAIARASVIHSSELLSRAPLYRAFIALLRRVSTQVPVIVTIDDIQWADEPSIALLEAILEDVSSSRLLVLATVRPVATLADSVGSRLTALLRHPGVSRITVDRLHESESRQLVSRLLGGQIAEERRERLVLESGGHPLFVSELVRHAQESSNTEAELDLDGAIVARVAQLDAHALQALTVSCLAAGPLPYSVLAAAVDMGHESLRSALAVLRARKLMRVAHGDETIFYHDRIREAVVQSRDPALCAAYHHALARAWEAEAEMEPVRVAYHFLQAGMGDLAVPWLQAAAERATKALAFERAAELYRRALSGVERTSPEREELCIRLGFALQHAGRREDAARAFEGAARNAQGATRKAMLLRAGDQWLTGGFTSRGLSLLRAVGVRVPSSTLFTLLNAAYHFAALALVRSLRVLSSKVAEDERAARVDSYWTLSTGLAFSEPLQSMYFSMKGARLSLSLGDSHRIARALSGATFAVSALGHKALAVRLNALTVQAASHQGTPHAAFYAQGGRFLTAFMIEHDWEGCIAQRAKLDELWRQAGLGRSFEMDVADLVETWALANLGHLPALSKRYKELSDTRRRGANPFLDTALRVYHSVLFLAADDANGAEADLDDALTSWSPHGQSFQLPHAWASFSRGEILLYRGHPEHRVELDRDLRGLRNTLLDRIHWVRIRRDHVQARLALAEAAKSTGKARTRALRDARRWLASLRTQTSPAADAWAALLAAGLGHVEGDAAREREHLECAVAAFVAMRMGMYEQAAVFRLGELQGTPEGDERCASARRWFAANGVLNVSRMLRMLSPGWS